ncbi:MAG: hypothetical protein WD627_02350 [Actinomycetota bacterium]
MRHASIVLAALFTVGLMATSAFAQVDDSDIDVGTLDDNPSSGGQSIGGDNTDPPPSGGGNANTPPGQPGSAGTGTNSGSDGADSFATDGRDQGQAGRPGVGLPGRSGNPSPTPSVRTPATAGGRTIPTTRPPLPGSRTVQAAGAPLLPFEVIPSPFPSLEPSPSPSPSPSPTDLVAAIDNIDPEPVADEGGSLVPLMLVLAGAAMLFVYFRSRKRASRRGMGPGRFSGNRTLR